MKDYIRYFTKRQLCHRERVSNLSLGKTFWHFSLVANRVKVIFSHFCHEDNESIWLKHQQKFLSELNLVTENLSVLRTSERAL